MLAAPRTGRGRANCCFGHYVGRGSVELAVEIIHQGGDKMDEPREYFRIGNFRRNFPSLNAPNRWEPGAGRKTNGPSKHGNEIPLERGDAHAVDRPPALGKPFTKSNLVVSIKRQRLQRQKIRRRDR